MNFYKFLLVSAVIFFGVLGLAKSSWAADFYVAQNQVGANDGSNCSNARSVSWFNTASNWANPKQAGKVGPGDTVHLCGTITTALTAQGSGSSGSPITIYFENGAKLSKPSWDGGVLDLNNKDYITVDGGTNGIIENTDNGTAGSYTYQNHTQAINASSCTGCEIKNLTIRNLYVRTSTTDNTRAWNLLRCVWVSGSNVSVHDITCDHAGAAVIVSYGDGDDNIRVYNNTFYNNAHNFVLSSGGDKHAGKIYFYNNHVYDYRTWDGAGCPYHNSAIHAYGITVSESHPDVDEFWIYNNKFEQPGVCSSGHVFLEGGTDKWTDSNAVVYFFNNVVFGGQVLLSEGQNYVIVNNTFIGSDTSLAIGNNNPTIKNNYFSGASITLLEVAAATIPTPSTIDYNSYANYSGYNAWCWPSKGCTSSWTTYLSNCVICDTHSYTDLAGYGGVNQTTGRPGIGSTAIDKGVNLSSLGIAALNSDKNGISRPQGSAWDIGAYEYIQASPPPDTTPPAAPSGVTII